MHLVREFTFPGVVAKTPLWVADGARDDILSRDGSDRVKLLAKLKRYTANGFHHYHGTAIEHEWEQVYRIGSRSDLFRIIGFYGDDPDFIAPKTYLKKGQELSQVNREAIDEVARIRRDVDWRKT